MKTLLLSLFFAVGLAAAPRDVRVQVIGPFCPALPLACPAPLQNRYVVILASPSGTDIVLFRYQITAVVNGETVFFKGTFEVDASNGYSSPGLISTGRSESILSVVVEELAVKP